MDMVPHLYCTSRSFSQLNLTSQLLLNTPSVSESATWLEGEAIESRKKAKIQNEVHLNTKNQKAKIIKKIYYSVKLM
jgi:hypothetical protein